VYINTLNEYLKKEYGIKVYKLALSTGATCPNRDGKVGMGGCIFCDGSGSFAGVGSIKEQIEEAKLKVKDKVKAETKYIAYFQSFTNTYGDETYLESLFMEAITHPDILILSIATRPDSISENMYFILERLSKIKTVWIELGLQTIYEKTATYINRCFELSTYDTCIKRLKEIGIKVIVHQILGLPYEDKAMMIETSKYIGLSGADGIKLHLLHILKNTKLATIYEKEKFHILSLDEYIDILFECIKVLPKEVVIHRLTGDGDKRYLLAPLWSGDKKKVLNTINRELKLRDIVQGLM
jgi:radical SAM protein, TIGR01212 family